MGTRTVQIGRLTASVFYPASPGATEGTDPAVFDIREALPESQQDRIPDEDAPPQVCDCAEDPPLDDAFGPYPVVIFVHGTASWRTQSLSLATLWASRGFVVLTADHPGLWLADILATVCPDEPTGARDTVGDVQAMLTALRGFEGDLAFLDGAVDLERIAVTGHSAGGSTAVQLAGEAGVRLVMPMASSRPVELATDGGSRGGDTLTTVFFAARRDGVVDYEETVAGFDASPAPKRFVGVAQSGHLLFSDICHLENDAGADLLTIAEDYGVCGAFAAGALFDCDPSFLGAERSLAVVGYGTVAALEEALMCQSRDTAWADYTAVHPEAVEVEVVAPPESPEAR